MSNAQNTVKVTKRMRFEQIKSLVSDNEELVAFIDHEIELLDKKNSRTGKPTKTQVENETIKNTIFNTLQIAGKPMTVTSCLLLKSLMVYQIRKYRLYSRSCVMLTRL